MALQWERISSRQRGANPDETPARFLGEMSIIMQNAVFDEGGVLAVRQGCEPLTIRELWDSTGVVKQRPRGIFSLRSTTASAKLIVFAGTGAYLYDADTGSWTLKKSGLTEVDSDDDAYRWTGTNFNGTFYFANGADEIQTYNPATDTWSDVSAVNNLKKADIGAVKHVLAFKNQLFIYPVNNNHVRFSPLRWNGSDDFVVTDDLEFGTQDVSETHVVTGGLPMGDQLIFTTNKGVYKVTGTSRSFFQSFATESSHGCVANNTLQYINGRAYWLSRVGIIEFDGYKTRLLSRAIERYWRSVDSKRWEYACSAYYQGNTINREWYIIFLTMKDAKRDFDFNNFAFIYDFTNNSWHTVKGWNGDCVTVHEDSNNLDMLLFGENTSLIQHADKYRVFDDDGYAIPFLWVFGGFGSRYRPETVKNFRATELWYGALNKATLKFTYFPDFADYLDSDGDVVSPNSRDVVLSAGLLPEALDEVKEDEKPTWDSYKVQRTEYGLNAVGRELYVAISNEEVGRHFFFHSVGIGARMHGERM